MGPISSIALPSSLPSAQSSGLSAIASSSRRLDQDAQQIADPNGHNVTDSVLDLSQALLSAQAGADVISTSNNMLGTLLDIFA
jgi:hypothetical protein